MARSRWSGGLCGVPSGRTHRPVFGSLAPLHIVVPLKLILHSLSSYIAWRPASHNALMEMRDVWARPGTMCAWRAAFGNVGVSRRHVWVDLISFPSGKVIIRGAVAALMSVTGAPGSRKWPVAPASAMAMSTVTFKLC